MKSLDSDRWLTFPFILLFSKILNVVLLTHKLFKRCLIIKILKTSLAYEKKKIYPVKKILVFGEQYVDIFPRKEYEFSS